MFGGLALAALIAVPFAGPGSARLVGLTLIPLVVGLLSRAVQPFVEA